MNNIRKYTAWLGAGAVMLTLAAGCPAPQQETSVGNVAESAVDSTANMADAAVDTTGNMASGAANTMDGAGTAVANGAMSAGEAVSNSASAAGSAIAGAGDATIYTPKIKTAIGASAAMKGSKIDVDTLADKKEIVLRGTVASSAQMKMAEAVAKQNAPADYTVVNQLKMGGKM